MSRTGPDDSELEIRILNRIAMWIPKGVMHEAEKMHIAICLQEVGLEEISKTLHAPIDISSKGPRFRNGIMILPTQSEIVSSSAATRYRKS